MQLETLPRSERNRLTVTTSTLAEGEMSFVRSQLGRVVVVALLPTPVISSISLAGDTRGPWFLSRRS